MDRSDTEPAAARRLPRPEGQDGDAVGVAEVGHARAHEDVERVFGTVQIFLDRLCNGAHELDAGAGEANGIPLKQAPRGSQACKHEDREGLGGRQVAIEAPLEERALQRP